MLYRWVLFVESTRDYLIRAAVRDQEAYYVSCGVCKVLDRSCELAMCCLLVLRCHSRLRRRLLLVVLS
jgi:hypothetical protein